MLLAAYSQDLNSRCKLPQHNKHPDIRRVEIFVNCKPPVFWTLPSLNLWTDFNDCWANSFRLVSQSLNIFPQKVQIPILKKRVLFKLFRVNFLKSGFRGCCGDQILNRDSTCKLPHFNEHFNVKIYRNQFCLDDEAGERSKDTSIEPHILGMMLSFIGSTNSTNLVPWDAYYDKYVAVSGTGNLIVNWKPSAPMLRKSTVLTLYKFIVCIS